MKTIFTFVIFLIVTSSYAQNENLDSLKLIVPTSGNAGDLDRREMSFSADGKFFVIYGVANKLKLFDLNSMRQLREFTWFEESWITGSFFSKDSKLIIATSGDNIIVFDFYNNSIIYNSKNDFLPHEDKNYLIQKKGLDSIQIIDKAGKNIVSIVPRHPTKIENKEFRKNKLIDKHIVKELSIFLLKEELINKNQIDNIKIEKVNKDNFLAVYNDKEKNNSFFLIYNAQKKEIYSKKNSNYLFSCGSKWIVFEDTSNLINIISVYNHDVVFEIKSTYDQLTKAIAYREPLFFNEDDSILVFANNNDASNIFILNLLNFRLDSIFEVEPIAYIRKLKDKIYYTLESFYYNYKLIEFDFKTRQSRSYFSKSLPGSFDLFDSLSNKIIFNLPKTTKNVYDYKSNIATIASLNIDNLKIDYEDFDLENTKINKFESNKFPFVFDLDDGIILCKDSQVLKFKLIFLENNNYIIQLPNSPYYMCSKDASKMLHYVTPSLKAIGFDQLDPIYNRPDIVLDSIGKYFAGGPDLKLIKQYRDAWVKRMTRLGLDTTTAYNKIEVPDAEIVNADNIDFNNTSGKINFHFKASDAKHHLRRYNVYVNEVPLYGSNGVSISEKTKQFEKDIALNLTEGNNKIQVSVMNDLGLENFRYPVYVQYQPTKPIVSNTYYIGIGVDSFATSKFNLQYCVKDVNDLGNLLGEGKNTKTIILKNKEVTKQNVLQLKKILQKTTEQDKVIISCSSHGLLDKNNNFYLAMSDVDFNHPEQNGLAYEDLQGLLDGIPARKKLLLLDACNSGENEKSDNNGLANSKDLAIKQGAKGVEIESVSDSSQNKKNSFETMMELFVNVNNQTGATVISAAGGKQSALEGGAVYVNGKPISNGAFTFSILEYLTQHQNDKNTLTVNQLKQYAEQRVTAITEGKQKPTSRQETMEVDWGL